MKKLICILLLASTPAFGQTTEALQKAMADLQQVMMGKDQELRLCLTRQKRNQDIINNTQLQKQTVLEQLKLRDDFIEKHRDKLGAGPQ